MKDSNTLHILWTNDNMDTSRFMLMMYSTNSMLRGFWDNVTVIIWGATAKLVSENEAIQEYLKIAQHAGVRFSACISCARQLGVAEALEALDIEVIPWGPPLTEIIKNGAPLITV
ncbi:MAG: DsrE family protein [Clostridiales bacterium]|nr:DsrE family protein [Clostridiales bacterium]